MSIDFYTVENLGKCAVREQAENAARKIAASSGKSVTVNAHIAGGKVRSVVYHPDGSVEKLWE